MKARVVPERDLAEALAAVEKPARYVGGEHGAIVKDGALFDVALCFPDLYEIGMSNHAMRILYRKLNALPGVRCERAYAAAPDFEAELKARGIPLYTLESGIPLGETDMVAFSVGYELAATTMLSMLDLAGIPLRREARDRGPLVIAGGPAITNPRPFAPFLDAVYIGEAEASFFAVCDELSKSKGAPRSELLGIIERSPHFWTPGKGRAARAVHAGFASPGEHEAYCLPVPTMKTVQDHGVVEIMRGCPNGCRFCHAGYAYRPYRWKSPERVYDEVEELIAATGNKELSLSSLSTCDYPGLQALLDALVERHSGDRVSFQLPSLRVNGMTLPLLEKVSAVRKSGLTFAVETPLDADRLVLNKEVGLDRIIEVLRTAKARGWKLAKFYFMIGLPFIDYGRYAADVSSFISEVQSSTGMSLNVSIATFIPKPHTPFQWDAQLPLVESATMLDTLRKSLSSARVKVNVHDPFVSNLEGIISRGDERIGELLLLAYGAGCRLDAWNEHIKKDTWKALIADHGVECAEALGAKKLDADLPWDGVSMGVSKGYFLDERKKAQTRELTAACIEECAKPCGSCNKNHTVGAIDDDIDEGLRLLARAKEESKGEEEKPGTLRILGVFEKRGKAAWIPHLSCIEAFGKVLLRSGVGVSFSEGFNPLPRMEILKPLAIGIDSSLELINFEVRQSPEKAREALLRINATCPAGFRFKRLVAFRYEEGEKKVNLEAVYASQVVRMTYLTQEELEGAIEALDGMAEVSIVEGSKIVGNDRASVSLRLCKAGIRAVLNRLAEDVKKPHLERVGFLAHANGKEMEYEEAIATLMKKEPEFTVMCE